MDVLAFGELLIDFAYKDSDEEGYPLLQANPGGAPCNFLAALARYGVSTGFIGKVGNDAFGMLLKETLNKLGIDVRGLAVSDDVFTTLAFVTINEDGDRSFSFARKPGADTSLTEDECDFSLIDETKVFHFGTLSLTNEPSASTLKKAVDYAVKKGKMISFDPNLRIQLWNSREDAANAMKYGLSKADVVKISDEEVRFLWNEGPEAGAKRILEEYGAKLVFVTLGPDGCCFANKNGFGATGAPVVKPVDTTGAGDIFGGSAMSRILMSGKNPEELLVGEMRRIASFASAAASLSTEKLGGMKSVPDEKEAAALMI